MSRVWSLWRFGFALKLSSSAVGAQGQRLFVSWLACCFFFVACPFCNLSQAQSICFKIQCDQYLQTAAKDATGERAAGLQALASTLTGQGITVSNIVDYMSLIEQRSIQVTFLVCRSAGGL